MAQGAWRFLLSEVPLFSRPHAQRAALAIADASDSTTEVPRNADAKVVAAGLSARTRGVKHAFDVKQVKQACSSNWANRKANLEVTQGQISRNLPQMPPDYGGLCMGID